MLEIVHIAALIITVIATVILIERKKSNPYIHWLFVIFIALWAVAAGLHISRLFLEAQSNEVALISKMGMSLGAINTMVFAQYSLNSLSKYYQGDIKEKIINITLIVFWILTIMVIIVTIINPVEWTYIGLDGISHFSVPPYSIIGLMIITFANLGMLVLVVSKDKNRRNILLLIGYSIIAVAYGAIASIPGLSFLFLILSSVGISLMSMAILIPPEGA